MANLHFKNTIALAACCRVATLLMTVVPASAMQLAYTACDEWGECWEQPDYRDSYEYDGRYPRHELVPQRPPTKWERKGFCPPGQHKKGNC
jgi:hypothetical protein